MLGLIDAVGWIIAIVAAVFGVACWIAMFTEKNGWHIFLGIIAVFAAVFVFTRVYAWFDSVGIAIFAAGVVLCVFGGACSDTPSSGGGSSKPAERDYTLGDAVMDTICEYELTKAAVKDAIRESKE